MVRPRLLIFGEGPLGRILPTPFGSGIFGPAACLFVHQDLDHPQQVGLGNGIELTGEYQATIGDRYLSQTGTARMQVRF